MRHFIAMSVCESMLSTSVISRKTGIGWLIPCRMYSIDGWWSIGLIELCCSDKSYGMRCEFFKGFLCAFQQRCLLDHRTLELMEVVSSPQSLRIKYDRSLILFPMFPQVPGFCFVSVVNEIGMSHFNKHNFTFFQSFPILTQIFCPQGLGASGTKPFS